MSIANATWKYWFRNNWMKIKRNLIVSEVSTNVFLLRSRCRFRSVVCCVDDDDDGKIFSCFSSHSTLVEFFFITKGEVWREDQAKTHNFKALVSQAILVITVLCRLLLIAAHKNFPTFSLYNISLLLHCARGGTFSQSPLQLVHFGRKILERLAFMLSTSRKKSEKRARNTKRSRMSH